MVMTRKNAADINGLSLQPAAVLQGFVLSQLLLLLIAAVLALAVYFSPWQASAKLLNVLAHVGVFAGAVWAGMRCRNKAWLHGVLVGVLAFLVFSVIGYAGPLLTTWLWWRKLIKMVFVAMLGGMLGGLMRSN